MLNELLTTWNFFMYKRIRVYDIDGVLVDTSHRYRTLPNGTIDLQYWRDNQKREKIMLDTLLPMSEQYIKDVGNDDVFVIICTSRQMIDADFEYINDRLGKPNILISRPHGNNEPDGILKARQLHRVLSLDNLVKLPAIFFDDSPKNIIAIRGLGVRSIHIPSRIYPNAKG